MEMILFELRRQVPKEPCQGNDVAFPGQPGFLWIAMRCAEQHLAVT